MVQGRHALSIIELLVVVAVLAVVLAVAPLVLPTDRFAVNQAMERFEADLRRARFEAVRTNQVVVFEVDANAGRYRAVGQRDQAALIAVDVSAGTGIVVVSEPELRIRFDPRGISYFVGQNDLPLQPGSSATVEFKHGRGASVTVEVNGYGRTRRG